MSQNNSKLCFIFDLDGTILDDVPVFVELFVKGVPAHFHKTLSPEREKALSSQALAMIGGKSSKFFMIRIFWKLLNDLGFTFRQKLELRKFIQNEYNRIIPTVPYFPHTLDVLKTIKDRGHYIALNTSSSVTEVSDRFKHRKQDLEIFDAQVTRSDIKNLKPAPDSILKICHLLKISPQKCVMIGDMEMDIEAGRRAGTLTVGLLSGFLTRENIQELAHAPDFVFQNIAELGENLTAVESALRNHN